MLRFGVTSEPRLAAEALLAHVALEGHLAQVPAAVALHVARLREAARADVALEPLIVCVVVPAIASQPVMPCLVYFSHDTAHFSNEEIHFVGDVFF